jgi:small subunit ribosomal protein S4
MARYTGPKHRLARKEGINVLDKTSASLQRRLNVPPGVHGKKRKKTLSEFGQQLREKQRAKSVYGLLEKQFKNLVQRIQERKGDTGEMIVQALETRLDNVVYRLGFAKTRSNHDSLSAMGISFEREKSEHSFVSGTNR